MDENNTSLEQLPVSPVPDPGQSSGPQPVTPQTPPPQAPAADTPDFQVNTVTDAQSIRTVMGVLISKVFTVGYCVLGALCLLMGLLLILLELRLTLLSGACLFLGALIFVLRVQIPRRVAGKQLKVLLESYGTDAVPLHLVFWPQGVVVNNTISGAHLNIRYDIIKKLIRHKGYLIFQTQANQSVILPLADVADKPDFLPYLLAKCPQAKKKGL